MNSQSQRAWSRYSGPVGYSAILLIALAGCGQAPPEQPSAPPPRTVTVIKPERKSIHRAVGQPGVIQAFERTPIVARIPGYVLKWHADIGDAIRVGDVLAELWVPEMASELKYKDEQVVQAKKALAMAEAQILTAKAHVKQAEAAQSRAQSNHDFWKGQSDAFARLVKDSTLDKQAQADALNQYRSAVAALAEAQAAVESARAMQQEKEFARDKAEADVQAAAADRQRQADLVAYATLRAPYDGVVTQRSVNTRQFVQPATGPQADVLYVVEKTDRVRIFVSVPETDAAWVRPGLPATVRVQALGQSFKGEVTRTAWSLNGVTRTLLTEIDMDNPELPKQGRRLRPGMYAYGVIEATSPEMLTLPASALLTEGDVNVGYRSFGYMFDQGKQRIRRIEIETGARNEHLVEVLRKRLAQPGAGEPSAWEPWTGAEDVVGRDLSGLSDGQMVHVSP